MLIHCWWDVKWYNSLIISWKVKQTPTIQPIIPLSDIYQKKNEIMCLHKDLYMFITTFSVIAQSQKQFKCPSTCEQKNKLWISIKWDSTQQSKGTIDICNIINDSKSERSQTKKRLHTCMTPFTQNSRKCKLIYSFSKQIMVTWSQRWREEQNQERVQGNFGDQYKYIFFLL